MNPEIYEISYAATGGNENFIAGEPYKTINYLSSDPAVIRSARMGDESEAWVAFRNWNKDGVSTVYSRFIVGQLTVSESLDGTSLLYDYSTGVAISYQRVGGVRPVVTLTSGLKATGEGTKNNPWIISN